MEVYTCQNNLEKFKRVLAEVAGCPSEGLSVNQWHLQIRIFRITLPTGVKISITNSLLSLLSEDTLKQVVLEEIKGAGEKGICSDETYIFLDQKFGFHDIYELQERLHVLYLDPAYCQNCTLSWSEEDGNFSTKVNGNIAIFNINNILDVNKCVQDRGRFAAWVGRTQGDAEIEPFMTETALNDILVK